MCRASTPNNYQAVADCDASDDCVGFAVKKLGGDFYVTYSDLACVETNAYEDEGGHWDLYVSSNLTSEDHTYGAALYFCDFDFDFDYTRRYFWRDTGECRPCPASASVAELALNCSAVTDAKYVPHGASVRVNGVAPPVEIKVTQPTTDVFLVVTAQDGSTISNFTLTLMQTQAMGGPTAAQRPAGGTGLLPHCRPHQ